MKDCKLKHDLPRTFMTLPVDILSFYHYTEIIRLYRKSIAVELKICVILCTMQRRLVGMAMPLTTVGTEIMIFSGENVDCSL